MLKDFLMYVPVELGFGTSGLRGLVTDMTDLECYINAKGFLNFLKREHHVDVGSSIYLAGDLRQSTPRITRVMVAAIEDSGLKVVYGGSIPTPAIAYYASLHKAPCIMVTGSHIPADRNGIKFYTSSGEVLKQDEAAIKKYVADVRNEIYGQVVSESLFDQDGSYKILPELPVIEFAIAETYKQRYTDVFSPDSFIGKHIVVYQHSAVGRDMVVDILESLGATVTPVARSEEFVPIDTENVTEKEAALFREFVTQNPDAFAVVSTDGDSDRPFVIDEAGTFYRGDVLGLVVARYVKAQFAAVPISANDAVDAFCANEGIELVHTRIGSPFVITAMQESTLQPAVGWEVNGGFLTGHDISINGATLKALPTRDAVLPILCALLSASESSKKVSDTFAALPARYTGGGLIDNIPDAQISVLRTLDKNPEYAQQLADAIFSDSPLGSARLDTTDGIRLIFELGDVIHLRASGNAPQVRVYTNASSQERADDLTREALSDNGYIAKLLAQIIQP